MCIRDSADAYGMAQSLLHALRQVVPSAMLNIKSAEWQYPKEGEPLMGAGRNLLVTVDLLHVPMLDAYVAIAPHVPGVNVEPEQTNAPFTTATSAVITSSITDDVNEDGPQTLTDTVTD